MEIKAYKVLYDEDYKEGDEVIGISPLIRIQKRSFALPYRYGVNVRKTPMFLYRVGFEEEVNKFRYAYPGTGVYLCNVDPDDMLQVSFVHYPEKLTYIKDEQELINSWKCIREMNKEYDHNEISPWRSYATHMVLTLDTIVTYKMTILNRLGGKDFYRWRGANL